MSTSVSIVPIKGFEDYYISSCGQVFTTKKGIIVNLKPWKRSGYPQIKIVKDGKTFGSSIHRLVALHFIEHKPDGKNVVNHINSIRDDNRVENLEWCTPMENTQHAFRMGRMNTAKGERHRSAKLKEEDVYVIRQRATSGLETISALAREYGVDRTSIRCIRDLKTWRHLPLVAAAS